MRGAILRRWAKAIGVEDSSVGPTARSRFFVSLSVCAVMMTVSGAKETKVSPLTAVCRELLLVSTHRREWWESGRGQYLVRTIPRYVALIQTMRIPRDPELSNICGFLHRHHPRIFQLLH